MENETTVVEEIENTAEDSLGHHGEEEIMSAPDDRQGLGDNSGVAVVEVILILVVLIALVIIFRDQITSLVSSIWKSINGDAKTLL